MTSKLAERMKQLDEQRQRIVAEAVKKQNIEGMPPEADDGDTPADNDNARTKNDGSRFPLAMIALVLLMVITMAVVVVFSFKTIDKVSSMSTIDDQLSTLFEEQHEQFIELQAHVDAMELEFRRAFKADREKIEGLRADLLASDQRLAADMETFGEELRAEVLTYKSAVTDNQSTMRQIDRDYKDLITRFNNMRQELKTLRSNVVELMMQEAP